MAGPRHGHPWARSLVGCLLLLAAVPGAASGATMAPGFFSQTVADGLSQPTAVAWLPDGRMLVAEQAGVVRVVDTDGTVRSTPLLDLSDEVNDANQRGLLGIAVAPDFATSRELYLLYTYDATYLADASTGQDSPSAQVARLTRVALDANLVPGSEQVILGSVGKAPCPPAANDVDCIPANAPSHTIGTVRADADGTLWVGSGDAASAGIVDTSALGTYDEQGFRGKILHVDGNGQGLKDHPFCPGDSDLDHVCTKVYAKGFRNPFRFSLRPGAGPLVGDVGWRSREEIDRVVPGGNYGWPCYEGAVHTPGYSDLPECAAEFAKEGTANTDVMPDYDYDHTAGLTVVAGFVYSGTGYPSEHLGQTVFGDYTQGFVRWLDFGAPGGPAVTPLADDLVAVDLEPAPDNGDVVYAGYSPFGEGIVGRIVHAANPPPVAVASADSTAGASPLTVKFDSKGSTGDDLAYRWSFGDGSADSTDPAPSHQYTTGVYHATLQVQDSHGMHATDHLTIAVGDQPPVATLSAPAASDTYVDGGLVQLVGSAKDPEDGTLTGARLSWEIRLHNGGEPDVTELPPRVGQRPVFQTRTDGNGDSYYEIVLTATDSAGLTDSTSVTIHPQRAPLQIDSDPPGAPITYDGVSHVAPWQTTSAVGFSTTISAAVSFKAGGHEYAIDHWSDGGAAKHDIQIPAGGMTLTAHYRDLNAPVPASSPPAPDALAPSDYEPVGTVLDTPLAIPSPRPRFSRFYLDRRRGRMSGRVDDVRSLDIALRGWRDRRGGCRWWSRRRGRLLDRSSCARPLWIQATVRGGRWSVSLWGVPPRGSYVALFRARDGLGNLFRASAATRSTT